MALTTYLALLIAGAAIVACIGIWWRVVARARSGREVIALEPRRAAPWTLVDLLLVLVAYILLTILGQELVRDVLHVDLSPELGEMQSNALVAVQLYLAVTLATLVFAFALVTFRTGATIADLGLSVHRLRSDLRLGAIAFLALGPLAYALQAVLYYYFPIEHPLIDLVRAKPDGWTFFIVGLSVSLVAPVSEEFFLRVLIQGWLERIVADAAPGAFPDVLRDAQEETPADAVAVAPAAAQSDNPYPPPQVTQLAAERVGDFRAVRAVPIFTSALIFALLHIGQGPAPIPLFFLAIGLGYLYQQTHRIWPSLVVHFLLNTSSLAMLWLEV